MRLFVLSAVAAVLVASPARAEVYSWTDDEGVIHFTNVPTDPRARLHPLTNRKNTFSWTDDLGAYLLSDLSAGLFILQAEHPGVETSRKIVMVAVDGRSTMDMTLLPSAATAGTAG